MSDLLIVGDPIALLNLQPILPAIWRDFDRIDRRAIAAIGERNARICHMHQHRQISLLCFICLPIVEIHPQIARLPKDANGVLAGVKSQHRGIDRVWCRRRWHSRGGRALLVSSQSIGGDRVWIHSR